MRLIHHKERNPTIMTTHLYRSALLPLGFALASCAHAAGTQPHEMSEAGHQAAAAQEQAQASQHAAQFDPSAKQDDDSCPGEVSRVCWTKTINPTALHMETSAEHQKVATQHRAASTALADAEARACVGVSEADRDTSPFAHRADISTVSKLDEEKVVGRNRVTHDTGATVVFRATPGLTAQWLQRVVNCHLARASAVGHDMPEMPYCPLVPNGAQATVREVGSGFAVDVRSDDSAGAAEIWRRAQLLSSLQ